MRAARVAFPANFRVTTLAGPSGSASTAPAGRADVLGWRRLSKETAWGREYPFIEFRDSPAGRQAYLQGTRLAVWHVAVLAREYERDASKTAAYLEIPEVQVKAALAYAGTYPAEIEAAIADDEWVAAHLLPLTPGFEAVAVNAAAS